MKLKEDPLKTALVGGWTTKLDSRVAFFGACDELECHIMYCRSIITEEDTREELAGICNVLFRILGEAAGGKTKLEEKDLDELLVLVKKYQIDNGKLGGFIQPGQTPKACAFHIARCVARRAELAYAKVWHEYQGNDYVFEYLNKISTLLFSLGLRYEQEEGPVRY